MITTVKGIVLHHVNYSESSVILQAYTDRFGRLSVMINSIRGKRTRLSMNMIQPLSLVEFEIYYKQNRDIQRIRDMSNPVQYHSIPYRIEKSTQAMFMAEILYKTLREEEANAALFDFLINAVQVLDLLEINISSFHLVFLVQLSKFLGFYPRNNFKGEECFFDLRGGQFASLPLSHPDYLDKELSELIHKLLRINLKDLESVEAGGFARTTLVDAIVHYYNLHITGFGKVRSLPVLREILSQ